MCPQPAKSATRLKSKVSPARLQQSRTGCDELGRDQKDLSSSTLGLTCLAHTRAQQRIGSAYPERQTLQSHSDGDFTGF